MSNCIFSKFIIGFILIARCFVGTYIFITWELPITDNYVRGKSVLCARITWSLILYFCWLYWVLWIQSQTIQNHSISFNFNKSPCFWDFPHPVVTTSHLWSLFAFCFCSWTSPNGKWKNFSSDQHYRNFP